MSEVVDYSCTSELKQAIPRLLSVAGIATKTLVAQESSAGRRFELLCTRDSSRVHIAGYQDGDGWTFTLDYANPFRYLFCRGDTRLLKEIESTLLQAGAVCNDPHAAAPTTDTR